MHFRSRADVEAFAAQQRYHLLDNPKIDALIEDISEEARLPRPGPYGTGGFSYLSQFYPQRLASRVARRIGVRLAPEWGVPPDVIAQALYFPIWSEFCTISVYRLAARKLRRLDGEQSRPGFLVPLPANDITCFNYWGPNESAKFFLADLLAKAGRRVIFFTVTRRTPAFVQLNFRPSRATRPLSRLWRTGGRNDGTKIVCEAGIRGLDLFLQAMPKIARIRQHSTADQFEFDDALFDVFQLPRREAVAVRLQLQERNDGHARYAVTMPDNFALGALESFWKGMTTKGWQNALNLHDRRGANTAYVCDHFFFESALVGAAMKSRGGQVVLLPHSSAPVHMLARPPSSFDAAVAVTKWSTGLWRSRFPGKPVSTRSDMMLPSPLPSRRFDREAPLSIVVFGGPDRLGAFPMMRLKTHATTCRRLLAMPVELQARIRASYKPKPGWRDDGWSRVWDTGKFNGCWHVERRGTLELSANNAIFVSVTLPSSAFLEGLARGIPAMLIADQRADHYVPIEGSPIPVVASLEAWARFEELTDPANYERLAKAQVDWFRDEMYQVESSP